MRYPPGVEIPDELQDVYRRAVRLEWLTLVYLISAVLAIYFTLGSSQAMKGAWLEDLLSLLPSIAFLIAARIAIGGRTRTSRTGITGPSRWRSWRPRSRSCSRACT